jgi:hypothetical protein
MFRIEHHIVIPGIPQHLNKGRFRGPEQATEGWLSSA